MRLLPPLVSTLATTVLVLTFGSAFFGWETSLLTPLSLLTVSLIMLQAQHVQQAEPVVAETDDDAVGFYRALDFDIGPAPSDPRWPGRRRYRCVRRS